jgi:hypothetical protein
MLSPFVHYRLIMWMIFTKFGTNFVTVQVDYFPH